jgi:predicted transcriptional regulator
MSKGAYVLELPAAVGRRVVRAAKRQRRKPAEIVAEAFEQYFSIPVEVPTAADLRAIRRGEAAMKSGDYITLDELRQKEKLERRPPRALAKAS